MNLYNCIVIIMIENYTVNLDIFGFFGRLIIHFVIEISANCVANLTDERNTIEQER